MSGRVEKGKLSIGDVEPDVDLIIAIANLIKIEEHLKNTYEATKDRFYLSLCDEVRRDRGTLLGMFLNMNMGDAFESEGDAWCVFKHSLSTWYGLREVTDKYVAISKDILTNMSKLGEKQKKELMKKAEEYMKLSEKLMEIARKERSRMIILMEYVKDKNKEKLINNNSNNIEHEAVSSTAKTRVQNKCRDCGSSK